MYKVLTFVSKYLNEENGIFFKLLVISSWQFFIFPPLNYSPDLVCSTRCGAVVAQLSWKANTRRTIHFQKYEVTNAVFINVIEIK